MVFDLIDAPLRNLIWKQVQNAIQMNRNEEQKKLLISAPAKRTKIVGKNNVANSFLFNELGVNDHMVFVLSLSLLYFKLHTLIDYNWKFAQTCGTIRAIAK